MTTWTITDKSSDGASTYEARTGLDALEELAKDEGFGSFSELCSARRCTHNDFIVREDSKSSGPEIGQFIPLDKPETLIRCLPCGVAHTIPLPTEVVVCKAEIISPDVARVYNTPWVSPDQGPHEGELWTSEDIQKSSHQTFEAVYLLEVWDDVGPEGHVLFKMQGWRLVEATQLHEAGCEPQKGPFPAIVYFLGSDP